MKNLSIKRLLHSLFLVSVISPQLSFAIGQITLSGVCGAIMTANNSGWEGVGSNFQAQMPNNAIGTINFDANTWKFNFSDVAPYGNKTHVDGKYFSASGKITFSNFDPESGVYTYKGTISLDATATANFNILPVNSGNTFLITVYQSSPISTTGPISAGVCQKI